MIFDEQWIFVRWSLGVFGVTWEAQRVIKGHYHKKELILLHIFWHLFGRSGIHPGISWDQFWAFSNIRGPCDVIRDKGFQGSSQICCPAPFKHGFNHVASEKKTMAIQWSHCNSLAGLSLRILLGLSFLLFLVPCLHLCFSLLGPFLARCKKTRAQAAKTTLFDEAV